jgi:predicted dehydrogenase
MTIAGSDYFRVLIIGCGNIAGKFDEARLEDAYPLTHAGAFKRHGNFSLVACVEPDETRRASFMRHWGVGAGFSQLAEIPQNDVFDVISICSPTEFHAAHLQFAVDRKPRLIFCEKPITPDVATSRRMVEACIAHNILLAVNHTRRWAPDVMALRDDLLAGVWGEVRGLSAVYNKGVLNNGSHMVDLIQYLLGEPLQMREAVAPLWDYWPKDPTVAALLETASGVPVHFNLAHAGDYAQFELTITCENGVISMEDGGAFWRFRKIVDSVQFKGYRSLDRGAYLKGNYDEAMTNAVENIDAALRSEHILASTGVTALAAQELCAQLKLASLQTNPRKL